MNKWDERYQGEDFFFGTEPHEFLLQIQNHLPTAGRALDLATGEGRNGIFLAQLGLNAEGVDQSAVGIAKARRLAELKGVAFEARVADINEMAMPPEHYAVISSVYCHFAEPERSVLAQKIIRALSGGGLFVGVFYHPEQADLPIGPSDVAMLADLETLQTTFDGLEWLAAEHRRSGEGDNARSMVWLLGQKPA